MSVNWWLAGTHQSVTFDCLGIQVLGWVDTPTHAQACFSLVGQSMQVTYPLWASSEQWKITWNQETHLSTPALLKIWGCDLKLSSRTGTQAHLWSCFKSRFTTCLCRTVNHQLLGDEGQLKVHVNIKFMSRSLNFLLTPDGWGCLAY